MDPQKLLVRALLSVGSKYEFVANRPQEGGDRLYGYPPFTSYSIHNDTVYLFSWNYIVREMPGTLVYSYRLTKEKIRYPCTSFQFFLQGESLIIDHVKDTEQTEKLDLSEGIEEIPIHLFEEWWLPYQRATSTKAAR